MPMTWSSRLEREKLRALARTDCSRANRPGYVVRCACDPSPDGSGGETVVDHVRLFPLRDDIRWTYRVHEQIMPALRRAGIPVRWTDLVVRHTGYVDLALRGRKLDRDARILQEELKDRPDEPFILFNLGAIAIERRDWHGALGFLRRSLSRSAPSDSITRKLFALIARAHQMLGDSAAALRTCAEGLAIDPEDAELLVSARRWCIGIAASRPRRKRAGGGSWVYGVPSGSPAWTWASTDTSPGATSRCWPPSAGDHAEAAELWRAVLAECPGDREAVARLERFPQVVNDRAPTGV